VVSGKDKSTPFYFTKDSIPAFSNEENAMLMLLYGTIIGPPDQPKKALMTADYNEDTNIMSIDASTTSEDLSLVLADRMFISLSNYYINKAIEKQFKTYTVVSAKKDSVLAVLKSNEYQLANFKDTHRGMLMRTDQISELRLQREITALSAMYAEVLKNTEIADFSLKNKLPFIQVIDEPLSPITPTQISLMRMLLMGIIIGGAIGCVFVIGRRFYLDLVA
jgi:LPS O-antigen subunit length determinant protein (WzzB/FepE family)